MKRKTNEMELENNERILLLGLVKEQIRNGNTEGNPTHQWDGKSYKKPRKKYGLAKMTTLYELEMKLSK